MLSLYEGEKPGKREAAVYISLFAIAPPPPHKKLVETQNSKIASFNEILNQE